MEKKFMIKSLLIASSALLVLSAMKPKGKDFEVVRPFDKKKYLGKWYEIARLDYFWERNLDNVTATYSLDEAGRIKVDNKGYDTLKGKWKQSIGKAKSVADPQEGRLKVSFFGPFYAGYNVVAVDEEYKYALVAGENTKYLWLLSREKNIPEKITGEYLEKARSLGYNTDQLIWVKHDRDE